MLCWDDNCLSASNKLKTPQQMIKLEHGAVMSYQAVTNPTLDEGICLKGLENLKIEFLMDWASPAFIVNSLWENKQKRFETLLMESSGLIWFHDSPNFARVHDFLSSRVRRAIGNTHQTPTQNKKVLDFDEEKWSEEL